MDPFSLMIKMTMFAFTIVAFLLKTTMQLAVTVAGARSRQRPEMPSAQQHYDPVARAAADDASLQAAEYDRQLREYQQRNGNQP